LVFWHTFPRFSKAALLLGFVVFGLISAETAQAQQPPPQQAVQAPAAAADPKGQLKASLNELSNIYQKEVERLEKQQQQSKDLYAGGLISRVEFENSEKALQEARAKVESVAKEIAVANQPASVIGLTGVEIASSAAGIWSTGNSRVDNLIRQYGAQYGVDPYLIYCLMSQESSFTTSATSSKGAQGLMQLMPGTAARYGVSNPYDVAQNIKGGTRYLKDLLQMFNGRVDLALAGYNAGEGAVMKYGYTVPPYDETRNYVRLILKRYGKKQAS
jgi:soluble lytic murein transglycosylase-like protein